MDRISHLMNIVHEIATMHQHGDLMDMEFQVEVDAAEYHIERALSREKRFRSKEDEPTL